MTRREGVVSTLPPLVNAIMPTYNRSDLLRCAVEAVSDADRPRSGAHRGGRRQPHSGSNWRSGRRTTQLVEVGEASAVAAHPQAAGRDISATVRSGLRSVVRVGRS